MWNTQAWLLGQLLEFSFPVGAALNLAELAQRHGSVSYPSGPLGVRPGIHLPCLILKVSILERKCQKRRFGTAVQPSLKARFSCRLSNAAENHHVLNDLRLYLSPPRKFHEIIFYVQ